MNEEWVVKSLTIWGIVISILTALLPALAALFPSLADKLTPEWLAGLNESVKNAITSIGIIVGAVLVLVDRLSGNTAKTLVLRKPE